ncbi:MAG: SH3 domain-containing protein [Anaerolineae bacterium]
MIIRLRDWGLLFALCLLLPLTVVAQTPEGQYAAALTVSQPGVEVLHVNTTNWIGVKVESVVGVGDSIRTAGAGRAQINYVADSNVTTLLPDTIYRITRFDVTAESYAIEADLQVGFTEHRLPAVADSDATYVLTTPGMTLSSVGTQFTARVEDNGRSAVLSREGSLTATSGDQSVEVPAGFGVRASAGGTLSDVVAARTYAELDAALDGCTVTLTTPDDVSLNVRSGPNISFDLIGYSSASDISTLMGRNESGNWYRIKFGDGFGWVLSSTAAVDKGCAGLRQFADDYGPETAAP